MNEGSVAWLIERSQPENHDPTVYWSGDETIGWSGWTTDAWKAVRYPTRVAADAVIEERFRAAHISQGYMAHAVEHGFVSDLPKGVLFESENKRLTVTEDRNGVVQVSVGEPQDFRSTELWAEDVALLEHALGQWVARFTSNA